MVAPLVGAAARMAAKKAAEKEAKRRAQIEAAKESVKEGAKTTAKAAGATGAAGATYLVGESMSPTGSGPLMRAYDQYRREQPSEAMQAKRRALEAEEKEPVKKAKGGMVSASKRADGIAKKGKTRGRFV